MTYNQFLEFLAQAYDKFNSIDGEDGPSYDGHAFMCFVLDHVPGWEETEIRKYFLELSGVSFWDIPGTYKRKLKGVINIFEDEDEDENETFTWRSDVYRKLGIEYASNRVKYRQANLHRPIWIREQKAD